MATLPLIGGSYAPRSIIASAQRSINYFPELNPRDSPTPMTHYQRPGLIPLTAPTGQPVRGLYQATNGNGYAVIGSDVYYVDPEFRLTKLGSITPNRSNLVSMVDNGNAVVLVDGSAHGWQFNVADPTVGPPNFGVIVDPTGIFTGGTKVDYIDTFFLFNNPGTNQFVSSLSNVIQFDGTYIAAKTDYADLLQTLIVNRHEILLLGLLKSEIWYNAGNPNFPFAELPGAYIEHGLAAVYGVCSSDISVFFLGRDLQGKGVVYRQRGYDTKRISNHAVEYAFRKMRGGISDCQMYSYQQDGHTFVVCTFPGGDQTWVYDDSIGDPMLAWHQRGWTDPQTGIIHRERANCYASLYDLNVVGDWENGTLYALDLDTYTDTVGGVTGPISFVRSFPHVGVGIDPMGQTVRADGKRMQIHKFWADLECGLGSGTLGNEPAEVSLRVSLDRGRTFGNAVAQSAGAFGDYQAQPQWRNLGISRHPVFELSHSIAAPAALNGAWIDVTILDQ